MSKAKITTVEELRKLITAESLAISPEGALDDESLVKTYTETLPVIKVNDADYRFTLDDVDAINEHNKRYGQVFGEAASVRIAQAAKDNADLGAAEYNITAGTTVFSTVWARPTSEEPSKKELAASIGFGMSHPVAKALEGKIRTDFAKLFLEDEEE